MKTPKELKAEFPDQVAALIAEVTAKHTDQLKIAVAAAKAEGIKEGAAAEQERIAEVLAQASPGHEKLIEALAADGHSTGADAAAYKTLRARVAADPIKN